MGAPSGWCWRCTAPSPRRTIHTTLYDPESTYPEFRDATIVTSPLNRIGPLRRSHRMALPFLMPASSRMQVEADVVLVSSSGWAHGFGIEGRSLIYCHAPARWLYQPVVYLGGPMYASARGIGLSALRPFLVRWDRSAAVRADRYLCNSRIVRERIKAAYDIDADVLHAPIGINSGGVVSPIRELKGWADDGFLLVVSRLMPYKNVSHVIEAMRGSDDRLLVIGNGPERHVLERDLPENVRIMSDLADAQMRWAYREAQALIAPSHEDYGLTPLEAGAWGKPTLALREGGYLDTVAEGVSGLFFDFPTAADIRSAITAYQAREWDAYAIQSHMLQFSEEYFAQRLRAEVAGLRP